MQPVPRQSRGTRLWLTTYHLPLTTYHLSLTAFYQRMDAADHAVESTAALRG